MVSATIVPRRSQDEHRDQGRRIAGIGRAGSPDITDGVELQIGPYLA
jgi:hypothetical protein